MFPTSLSLVGLVIAVLVFIVLAEAIGSWHRGHGPSTTGSKLHALLKEKLTTLQMFASQMTAAFEGSESSWLQVLEANRDVGHAKLDLCNTDQQRLAVLERLLAQAENFEKDAAEHVKSRRAPGWTALKAKLNRLEVEIALERAKAG
jgi:hypothetical protein